MGPLLTTLFAAFAPILEQLIGGIGKFLTDEFTKWFGVVQGMGADVPALIDGVVVSAERVVSNVTNDAAASLAWVESQFPSWASIEAAMPGTMQYIHAKSILMADAKMPHPIAAHMVQVAVANVRVKAKP